MAGVDHANAPAPIPESPKTMNGLKRNAGGYTLGRLTSTKVALHGATPVAQRAGAAQAAVTATVGAAVVTTAATNTSPFGFATGAQADALVARVNSLRTDVLALTTLCNELRAALVEKGAIKGAA